MTTNYPTSIDTFVNPTSNDSLNSPSHSQQHANLNDAMIAVQTKLGYGNANKVGMDLITTSTFTSVASVSLDNVFTTTYKHYLIAFELQRSSSSYDVTFQYRKSGSNNSSSAYVQGGWYFTTGGSFGNYGSGTQTQQYLGSSYNLNGIMTVHNPMDSSKRTLNQWDGTAGGTTPMFKNNCYHDIADAYDGFSVIDGGSSVLSGSICVYGLRNS